MSLRKALLASIRAGAPHCDWTPTAALGGLAFSSRCLFSTTIITSTKFEILHRLRQHLSDVNLKDLGDTFWSNANSQPAHLHTAYALYNGSCTGYSAPVKTTNIQKMQQHSFHAVTAPTHGKRKRHSADSNDMNEVVHRVNFAASNASMYCFWLSAHKVVPVFATLPIFPRRRY